MKTSLARIQSIARRIRLSFGLSCVAMIACNTGCQFAPQINKSAWAWQKDTGKVIPDRILPVWTDSVLHQPGQPGVRGFGGRVYFYGKEKTDPIEVDGSFAVYVFDAEDNAPTDQKPLRKFVFTADQFKTHMSKTSMGPSYSVWVPWGEVGGAPRRLSLISRFEGRDGGTTISDPTIKMLPGIPTNKEPTGTPGSSSVSLATHSESIRENEKRDKQDGESTVGSIDLPPAFQRHLRSPSRTNQRNKDAEEIQALLQPAMDLSSSGTVREGAKEVSETTVANESTVAPLTTHVYDYRTRGSQRTSATHRSKLPKNDIHDVRWIQAVSRSDKRE